MSLNSFQHVWPPKLTFIYSLYTLWFFQTLMLLGFLFQASSNRGEKTEILPDLSIQTLQQWCYWSWVPHDNNQKWRPLSKVWSIFPALDSLPLILSRCGQNQLSPVAGKTDGVTSQGKATLTQGRWIKLDLPLLLVGIECKRDRLHNNFGSVWVFRYFSKPCTFVMHA